MENEVVVIGSRRVDGKIIERTWKTTYACAVEWFQKNNPAENGWVLITVIRNTNCGHEVHIWGPNRVSHYVFDFKIDYNEFLS